MNEFYDFLAGSATWIAFGIFFGGLAVRLAYLLGLSRASGRGRDRNTIKSDIRSRFHRLNRGSTSMRNQPLFSAVFYMFHIGLIAIPLLLPAHNLLLQEALGLSFPSLPESITDLMTAAFIIAALFLLLRRIIIPEARILSSPGDYFLLTLAPLSFLAGFLAYHQFGPYKPMLILHVLSSEILLIIFPFTKFGHLALSIFCFETEGEYGTDSMRAKS